MKFLGGGILLVFGFCAFSCSAPALGTPPGAPATETPSTTEADIPEVGEVDPSGGSGGAAAEDNPGPNKLTGLPGIDRAKDWELQILDARGTGRLGGVPIPTGRTTPLTMGEWMLTDDNSEYEITLRSSYLPDGIVRLDGQSAFLVEAPRNGPLPRFRVFGGHGSFYLPHIPQGELTILTPAGPLVTRGAVFTVTISPDFQVLVTCREGAIFLTGNQNAVAQPGQVLVADRLGRGRVYDMTPNEALVFTQRWLKVMTEESAPVVTVTLPRRLAAWDALPTLRNSEDARFLALWFREARSVLGPQVPGPDTWSAALGTEVRMSSWEPTLPAPGLLGELP